MEKLSDFKKNKIDLKNIVGGKLDAHTCVPIWAYPGGADTPGNYIDSYWHDK